MKTKFIGVVLKILFSYVMMEKDKMILCDFLICWIDELRVLLQGCLALGSTSYSPDEVRKFLSLAEEVYYANVLRGCLGEIPPELKYEFCPLATVHGSHCGSS